jgi:hypothetical protein
MKRHRVRILFVISVIILVALACTLSTNKQDEKDQIEQDQIEQDQSDQDQILQDQIEQDLAAVCNGNNYLKVQAEITKNEVTQFGTSCWYKLTITNTHPDYYIWPFIYNWHEDGYQNIKEGRWQKMIRLGPGKSIEWTGNYTTYKDTDAKGPNVNEAQHLVGIFDSPDCMTLVSMEDVKLPSYYSLRPTDPCSPGK